MNSQKNSTLRTMLGHMTTDELDEILNIELEREKVDADAVKLIVQVLKEKDKLHSETAANKQPQKKEDPAKHSGSKQWSLRTASLAIVCALLLVIIPWQVNASYFSQRIARWTDKFLEIFSTEDPDSFFVTYAYATENEDLQTVHGNAVEEDILLPSVPMWIPEGYRLDSCDIEETSAVTILRATFGDRVKTLTLKIERHISAVTFYPDSEVTAHERYGITHYVFREDGEWVVVWTNKNILCTLRADCEEDVLLKIIDSVYIPEID